MALLEILKYPDPRLAKESVPIGEITQEIIDLVEDMKATMYAAPGVGLAAPQVGHNIRLIVMDPSPDKEVKDFRVLINPEIELLGECIISRSEGCLSVPFDYRADVKRHDKIRVKALNLEGHIIDEEWEDFPAIVLQHEFDHLNGTLFIDYVSRLKRTFFDSKVKRMLRDQ